MKNQDIRIIVKNNTVYGNQNFIPFYNEKWEDPVYLEANGIVPAREGFGTAESRWILHGHGIVFEANGTTSGIAVVSHNRAYANGVAGMLFNSPIDYQIHDNTVYDNGLTPRELPEDRPHNTGIQMLIRHGKSATLYDNYVRTLDDGDRSYSIRVKDEPEGKYPTVSHYNAELSFNNTWCLGRPWLSSDDVQGEFETILELEAEVCAQDVFE